MSHNFIVVEGNIGAGKTSLSHLLANTFGMELLLEEFENNPYLPLFYEDRKKYGYSLEQFFLESREKQLDAFFANYEGTPLVADFSLYKSFIFAQNNLSKEEIKNYTHTFERLSKKYPKPDLFIFLDVAVDRLQENIQERGRIYEKKMEKAYLEEIAKGYATFLSQDPDFPILSINSTHIDFVNKKDDFEKILALIAEKYDKGIHHREL